VTGDAGLLLAAFTVANISSRLACASRRVGNSAMVPRSLEANGLPTPAALADLQQPPTLKSFATDHTYLLSLWSASSSGCTMVNWDGSDVNANGFA